MRPSGEQSGLPTPQPVADSVHLEAHASGDARINQAARDLHLHYQDGVHGVRRAEAGSGVGQCPYPGLASFERAQARWFFGREQLTAELIARLDARLRIGGVQIVVAPSGAGKSSLLHAGLLPQLDTDALPGSSRWPTTVLTPTAHPLAALGTEIGALTGADPAILIQELVGDSHRAGLVLREALRSHIGRPDTGAWLIVVDQFEELFTLCTDDQQRRTFVELLSLLASPQSGTDTEAHPIGLVVAGIRADFYAACANYPRLRTALQDNPLVIGPMSDTELKAAILYPARDVGLDLEAGLVELLLSDLGDPAVTAGQAMADYEAGRLPLLAHALRVTWQQRHGHTLTVEGYRSTGGIRRAVASTAEGVFTSLDIAGQHTARTLFLRLTRIGDGSEDTRRRLARTDLLQGLDPGKALPVLDAFTRGRLLTQEQDTVEITHEALVRAWPRLRGWIDTDRAGNLIRQEIEEATAIWDRDRRDTAGLYRGSRLEAARTWATSNAHEGLSPAASEFLAASTQQEHRTTRLRQAVLIMLSVLSLLVTTASVFAFYQRNTAQAQRDTAILNQIIIQADRLRSTDVSLAAQLDLTGYRMRQTPDLYTTLITTENAALSTSPAGHTSPVDSVVFSPDGRTLASSSDDHTVRLWNVTDPSHPIPLDQPLTGHTNAVHSVVFSPDGRTLASGSADDTVRLWNVTDPSHPIPLDQPLTGHTNPVDSVVFSPDGRTLASGSDDHTVRLWNVTDPSHPIPLDQPLTGHTNAIYSVVFSPDGCTLASGSADRTVRLWNVADPSHPIPLGEPLTGHVDHVDSVVFSPDGRTLASSSDDSTVRLWNVADPTHPTSLGQPLTGHTNAVHSVVFSPDGRTLASGSNDHTVRLWNVADPSHPTSLGQPLTGHTNPVASVAFSPEGHTLASGSTDTTVRLWNIPYGLLTSHTNTVNSVVFSPDGRILASGSVDRTVRLWNVADPSHPTPLGQPLTGHTNGVYTVAFSPEGHTLASGSSDDTVRLWNVTDPSHPTPLGQPLTGHADAVNSVVFSPDGHTLASGSADRTVRLWNVVDPTHPIPLGQLLNHTDYVYSVAFSPDGHSLASGSHDSTVRLWDVADPSHPTSLGEPLTGHTNVVYSVVFSPDGRTLASGSHDSTVRLWNVADPSHPTPLGQPLTGHTNPVASVAFSPDGHSLASGSGDHTVRLWGTNVDQAIRRICAISTNTLTPVKWKQLILSDLPYRPPCA
jgi:WD40 repeat protein